MLKKGLVPVQASFFGEPTGELMPAKANGTGFSDPSFAVNKESPVHRWVPWIAGFSKTFVSDAIERHMHRKGSILDPFAGVGTTLVEALLAGHNAIGFEINPYAALACRIKVDACKVSLTHLRVAIADFERFYTDATRNGYKVISEPPTGFNTRSPFFSPSVLHKVLIIQDFLRNKLSSELRDLFAIAFAATMVSYSNYSYEPSLSRRTSSGKFEIQDFPVGQTILSKLQQMMQDIAWMARRMAAQQPTTQVYNETFFNCHERLANGSIDLIITSPPYLNNYHYNRNTRPHLYWLGFAQSPHDFYRLENENFGKYWQTVREKERIDIDFPNPDSELIACLELMREQKPEKGIYGGNGWANYAAAYFNDCHRLAVAIKRVLRRRGTALIVIGNNIIQGIMVPTDRYLARIAEHAGLEVREIHVPRATRIGNSIIQSGVRAAKAGKSDHLYEAVVELRKR